MHNSKCNPNNDVEIDWGRLSWRMLSILLLTAALCQCRYKQMQVTIEEAQGAQSWEEFLLLREILSDGTEGLVEMYVSYRQTWFQEFSTVLNTKFEDSHVLLSQNTGNLKIDNLCSYMILIGSSCIWAILLHVQCSTQQNGKHTSQKEKDDIAASISSEPDLNSITENSTDSFMESLTITYSFCFSIVFLCILSAICLFSVFVQHNTWLYSFITLCQVCGYLQIEEYFALPIVER